MTDNCEGCKKRVDPAFTDERIHHIELTLSTYCYGVHEKKLEICTSCVEKITQGWLTLVELTKTEKGK